MHKKHQHNPQPQDAQDNTDSTLQAQAAVNEKTLDSASEVEVSEPTADAAPQASGDEARLAELEQQVSLLKEQVMRERAENDNLRKRQERDLQNAHKYATERLIRDLLPVMDSLTLGLDAAQKNAENPEAIAQFIEGSEMTCKLLSETLAKHGVEELSPEGEKFNPEQHEAVTAVSNADVAPNTVLHVAQKGYTLNGRVIRAAQVIVVKSN